MPIVKRDLPRGPGDMIDANNSEIHVNWHQARNDLDFLVKFFIDNVHRRYISHGEVQDGRASDFRNWSPHLGDVLRRHIQGCLKKTLGNERIAVARQNGQVLGIAIVQIFPVGSAGYAILHDLVIQRRKRGKGVGKGMIIWLESQLKKEGIVRIFLESGKNNNRAHAFFHREGYMTCSQVMYKDI